MSIAILSLGSNIGNRLEHLKKSVLDIKSDKNIRIKRYSDIYETEPIGVLGQKDFYNCVITVETTYNPLEFLKHLQAVEIRNGRTREYRWSPRTIDIDIIDYDKKIIETQMLTLPHPLMHKRKFVLSPLKEVYADYIHPVSNTDIETMINRITGQYCYKLNMENWYEK